MDAGTIFGYILGYFATIGAVFLLYLPVLIMFLALLIAGGVLQLLLLPFVILVHKLRRSRPEPDTNGRWIFTQAER
ncbi:UNVERIFIED_ORG: hypothetical protein ABIB21_003106 [Arthrobacter sp. UYEF13]